VLFRATTCTDSAARVARLVFDGGFHVRVGGKQRLVANCREYALIIEDGSN